MDAGELRIDICGVDDRKAAMGLVLRPLPVDQRAPLVATLGRLEGEGLGPFDGLIAAHRGGRLVAATWAQPQPGRTAALWLPEFDDTSLAAEHTEREAIATELIRLAMRQADAARVEMSQVLLESEQDPLVGGLRESDFRAAAELEYLAWSTNSTIPAPSAKHSEVALVSAATMSQARLEELVTQTYVDTLDCPEMEGVRSIADVLAGYRQTGDHDPELWFTLQYAGEDIGVLLLSEHRSSRQMELIYMGVVPSARGKRIGQFAVSMAQQTATNKITERLVLAVDTRNKPAKSIYLRAGFQPWARRFVWIRQPSTKRPRS